MSPAPAPLETPPAPSDAPIAIPTYRTFVDRSCGDLDVFKVLRDKAGLSTAVPLDADLEAEHVDINDFAWLVLAVCLARWTDPFHPEGKTVIHRAEKRGSDPYFWNTLMKRDSRDLAAVYLDTAQKEGLVKGLEFFLTNKALYDRTGVTWKRIHLLRGPSGTRNRQDFNLPRHRWIFQARYRTPGHHGDLKATDLEYLLSNMPSKAFLLLEDVDALFAHGRESKTNVDFSTLINAMDGIAIKKGMVVFMTTNNLEKLDPARIRSGRVDFCMDVGLPSLAKQSWRRSGAPSYASEHEEFADRCAKGLTIAAIQKHVFDCLVEGRASMLSEVEVLALLGETETRS
ncbi:hypothetical protein M427DRAFT_160167 [Gonapodya prolifera JEL478]|uniref:ATPase AAA-type core domain-containing protein n=1 Tax=Gonapodya prolifera (strain JEL478) TaxID=1344416 RepID=A0A138ZZ77_GONPJ|nr:hypothetical protein M427DRAFT_160167 [Gonapodya prolifera JEL478]|eukprot:KXS09809.1 hypothetical protein M427DRAFT_160167 [Gonapodya prolifera JEL478]